MANKRHRCIDVETSEGFARLAQEAIWAQNASLVLLINLFQKTNRQTKTKTNKGQTNTQVHTQAN